MKMVSIFLIPNLVGRMLLSHVRVCMWLNAMRAFIREQTSSSTARYRVMLNPSERSDPGTVHIAGSLRRYSLSVVPPVFGT